MHRLDGWLRRQWYALGYLLVCWLWQWRCMSHSASHRNCLLTTSDRWRWKIFLNAVETSSSRLLFWSLGYCSTEGFTWKFSNSQIVSVNLNAHANWQNLAEYHSLRANQIDSTIPLVRFDRSRERSEKLKILNFSDPLTRFLELMFFSRFGLCNADSAAHDSTKLNLGILKLFDFLNF